MGPTGYVLPTTTPKPHIEIGEVNTYQQLFEKMDPENRVLGIYSECQSIVPSNLSYDNNTEIMIDNTRSSQPHVLKIGPKEYSLDAGAWMLTTLSSETVPVDLSIMCENIELGSIRLE